MGSDNDDDEKNMIEKLKEKIVEEKEKYSRYLAENEKKELPDELKNCEFPESDKSCSVLTLYKGGNKVLYFDDAMPEINADLLFMNMSLYLKDRYGDTNYKRNIVEFSRQTGIRLNQKKFPDVSFVECRAEDVCKNIDDKNSPIPIIEINRFGEKLSYFNYHIHFEDSETDHVDDEMISIKKTPFIHRSYRSDFLQSLSSK